MSETGSSGIKRSQKIKKPASHCISNQFMSGHKIRFMGFYTGTHNVKFRLSSRRKVRIAYNKRFV